MTLRVPPWSILGADLTSQIRFIVWELEGGNREGATMTVAAHDRGRETIAGLTWRCYSEDFLRLPRGERCPIADFQQLTVDDVVEVMTEVFALRTSAWQIADPRLRLAIVDYALHAGADDAIPALQRAAGVDADGHLGPITIAAVNHADPEVLRERVMDERYQKAAKVVLKDRDQLANLLGWTVRFGRVLRWRPA